MSLVTSVFRVLLNYKILKLLRFLGKRKDMNKGLGMGSLTKYSKV